MVAGLKIIVNSSAHKDTSSNPSQFVIFNLSSILLHADMVPFLVLHAISNLIGANICFN
jgi:hypothetical protein